MTFDDLFAAHYQSSVKYARRHLSSAAKLDSHVAEQLVLDIFLEINDELKLGKVLTNPPGYIHAKMRCKVVDFLRQQTRTKRQLPQVNLNPDLTAANRPFPDDRVALQEALDLALSRLKPVERQAIQLCYIEGHTHKEAAAVQNVPQSTFEKRIMSATRKAKHFLQKGQHSCCDLIPCTL